MNRDVQRIMLRQAGVISRRQASAAGLSGRQISYRLSSSDWVQVLPSVYRSALAPPTAEASLRAASLWVGPGVVTGLSAGWWWGFTAAPPERWKVVIKSGVHLRAPAGITVSRAYVDPFDWCEHRGTGVISLPLAVLRSATALERGRPGSGIALVDRAKQQSRVSTADLESAFGRNKGTWGTRAMRKVLDRTGDRAHSELERMGVRLLSDAGISGFTVNYRTRLSSGRPLEFDVAFEAARFAIEFDGFAYHSSPEQHRADVQRANEVMADGWTVRRFTYSDLLNDAAGFIAIVRQVLAL